VPGVKTHLKMKRRVSNFKRSTFLERCTKEGGVREKRHMDAFHNFRPSSSLAEANVVEEEDAIFRREAILKWEGGRKPRLGEGSPGRCLSKTDRPSK